MPRIRSFYDADRADSAQPVTKHKTDQNSFELFCGMCGAKLFANREVYDEVTGAMEKELENTLLCEDCDQEYEELAHKA